MWIYRSSWQGFRILLISLLATFGCLCIAALTSSFLRCLSWGSCVILRPALGSPWSVSACGILGLCSRRFLVLLILPINYYINIFARSSVIDVLFLLHLLILLLWSTVHSPMFNNMWLPWIVLYISACGSDSIMVRHVVLCCPRAYTISYILLCPRLHVYCILYIACILYNFVYASCMLYSSWASPL